MQTKHVDQPFELVIEATLTADGDQTVLVVEERGMPLDLLHGYGAGIQIHFEHLADHIAGREPRDIEESNIERALGASSSPPYQALAANVENRKLLQDQSERGAAGRLRELLRQQPSWGRATQGRLPWRRRVCGCARRVSSLRV